MLNPRKQLQKFIYLSIITAVFTISFKTIAYFLTNSVGLLSDALESIVNLVAAIAALVIFNYSVKPADAKHNFGHAKAEYFSSIIEGTLVLIAALTIIISAVQRLLHPAEITAFDIGALFSILASVFNLITAQILIRNGRRHHSMALEADGQHLMTDVWTSVGVLTAVVLVKITNLQFIDPLIAILVALHIIKTGFSLIRQSVNGLLDPAVSQSDRQKLLAYLRQLKAQGLLYHKLRTQQANNQKVITFHLLVPDDWTIKQAHEQAHAVSAEIKQLFNDPTDVIVHIEPLSEY